MTSIRRATVRGISGVVFGWRHYLGRIPAGARAFAANACVNPPGDGGRSTQHSSRSAPERKPGRCHHQGEARDPSRGHHHQQAHLTAPAASASSTSTPAASTTPQNGVTITKVKGKTVLSGSTIEDAPLAVISVQRSSGVAISNNVVQGNEKNLAHPRSPEPDVATGALASDFQDCVEGINLNAVVSSVVESNLVQKQLTGGILLSDDFCKFHANIVEDNGIRNNSPPPGFLETAVSPWLHTRTPSGRVLCAGLGRFQEATTTATHRPTTGRGVGIPRLVARDQYYAQSPSPRTCSPEPYSPASRCTPSGPGPGGHEWQSAHRETGSASIRPSAMPQPGDLVYDGGPRLVRHLAGPGVSHQEQQHCGLINSSAISITGPHPGQDQRKTTSGRCCPRAQGLTPGPGFSVQRTLGRRDRGDA